MSCRALSRCDFPSQAEFPRRDQPGRTAAALPLRDAPQNFPCRDGTGRAPPRSATSRRATPRVKKPRLAERGLATGRSAVPHPERPCLAQKPSRAVASHSCPVPNCESRRNLKIHVAPRNALTRLALPSPSLAAQKFLPCHAQHRQEPAMLGAPSAASLKTRAGRASPSPELSRDAVPRNKILTRLDLETVPRFAMSCDAVQKIPCRPPKCTANSRNASSRHAINPRTALISSRQKKHSLARHRHSFKTMSRSARVRVASTFSPLLKNRATSRRRLV